MSLRKFRWSKDYESAEEELIELFNHKHIEAKRMHIEPHTEINNFFSHASQIWCAEGSFSIQIQNKTFSMQPGDALDIPEQTSLTGVSGITGCAFYLNER